MAELRSGRLTARVVEGDLRAVSFAGHEVLRRVSYPGRDADWGTCQVVTRAETLDGGACTHHFDDRAGAFSGLFQAETRGENVLALSVEIRFRTAMTVDRAGFMLLHPMVGVAGTPMRVGHPDGRVSEGEFPPLIAPDQPARDVSRLSHKVGPVAVGIAFSGEVFEMEDQRNWSDASFKICCRPLVLPRAFAVSAGEVVQQGTVLSLGADDAAGAAASAPAAGTARLRQVVLAHRPGLSTPAALAGFPGVPMLLRIDAATAEADLRGLSIHDDVAVDVVFRDFPDLDRLIARVKEPALRPSRIPALLVGSLAPHQPAGLWPEGPVPRCHRTTARGFSGRSGRPRQPHELRRIQPLPTRTGGRFCDLRQHRYRPCRR
mgnify:CR=1 FL=1